MTNTIPNVPRELLADLLCDDHDRRIMAERHLLAMLANAQSPAGVDGLEVIGYLLTKGNQLSRMPAGAADEPLCRLSAAQAIIDGLRGEVAEERAKVTQLEEGIPRIMEASYQFRQQRDQLAGMLREERTYASVPASCQQGIVARCICRNCRLLRIDAALSAGKEVE